MSSPYPPPPESQGHPGMPPSSGYPGTPSPGGYPGMPPASGPMPTPPLPAGQANLARPQSATNAVRLMWAGAGLSVVSLLLTPASDDVMRRSIEDAMAGQPESLTPQQIDGFVTLGVAMGIVFGIIALALWLFMAWANGTGRSWARIVATVLFALNAVFLLASLPQVGAMPLAFAVSALTTLVGALAVYFLWRKDSSDWFEAQSMPRY
ncbi:hypothetical protein P0Y31_04920 [Knoellia sp. 3-2P3]|uniref:hypothetical protein n=1 Tax=unclassified Knoellia TaxID=2618719 RepID=UPI0023DB6F2F|nr:hypothetical protein [Knoellia sp. 3-2P3]MDF2091676.1 hypothetical protein [Knoellia sp. 3-2P3]